MNRVSLVDRNATTADRKALLDSIHGAFRRYAQHVPRRR
jgi:hypothetical protein